MTTRKGAVRNVVIAVLITVLSVVVIAPLMVIFLPSLQRERDLARRATCVANLNAIGKAIHLYRAENGGHMPIMDPRMVYDPAGVSVPSSRTQTDGRFRTGSWGALGTNPMQNMWLLIAEGMLDESDFRCSADADYQSRNETVRSPAAYGWVSPFNYSYGMHVPYDSGGNAVPLTAEAPEDPEYLVILADQMPLDEKGYHVVDARNRPVLPPSNHTLGTVFLTFSGEVGTGDIANSECGMNGDEIYANAAGMMGGIPSAEGDTSIAKSGRFEAR